MIAHLVGMISSYVVLWTAFYVDNAHVFPGLNQLPTLTFWVAPTLIAIPFLVRSIKRFAPSMTDPSMLVPSAMHHEAGDALQGQNESGRFTTHTGS